MLPRLYAIERKGGEHVIGGAGDRGIDLLSLAIVIRRKSRYFSAFGQRLKPCAPRPQVDVGEGDNVLHARLRRDRGGKRSPSGADAGLCSACHWAIWSPASSDWRCQARPLGAFRQERSTEDK